MQVEVDFNLKYTEKFSTNSNMAEETSSTLTHQRESSNHDTIPPTLPFTGSGSFEAQSQKSKSSEDECVFILPDLNMIPSEDWVSWGNILILFLSNIDMVEGLYMD